MFSPVLATKLYIPPPPPKVVHRPHLIERLDEGLHRKLTLISAPAGFGKTTLISEWLAAPGMSPARRVAWLSLDAGDGDFTRFLAYLVAALQTVAEDLGDEVLGALHSPQPPSTEVLLTALLNQVSALPDPFILILEDYHLVDASAVDQALAFLVEHLPPRLHLVITTREDPQLPLARLRARGQMTELRAADLRFSPAEAAAFLNQAMGLALSAEQVAALEARTEGWIAGLQLAALSMRGRTDAAGFVTAFTGDHRYIVDYLVKEVLQRQPELVRSFLLQTAILERLNGPLCDAVTGQEQGSARLEALAHGNFFVAPLDDTRQWYRYHHLFAEVLTAHLRAEQPEQIAGLHRRASEWYAGHGLPDDAIHHALTAADFERAAGMIEQVMPVMRRSRQEAILLGWLKALPNEVVRRRPVLSVHYAGALLANGKLEGVEAHLWDAERRLEPSRDTGEMVVVDEEEFRRLPGLIAVYRAGYALARGDVAGTMQSAHRALDLIAADDAAEDELWRGAAAALLGLASWTSGDLDTAYRSYAEGMAHLQKAGHISDAVGGAIALADIRITQGRLREAMRIYERSLQLAAEHGTPVLRGTADMLVGISELHRERNDLPAAMQHLQRSKEQGEHTGFPQNPYRWRVALARIREVEGDLGGALDLLHEAERLYVSDLFPNIRPIAALRARMWVAQGRLDEALAWAQGRGLSTQDALAYLREFEHITLARVCLARHRADPTDRSLPEVMGLLERLLQAAEAGGRGRSVIEILVLQALAHQMQGDLPAALASLTRALGSAEPEGYVRLFVDEGASMAQLLEKAAQQGFSADYIRRLRSALGNVEDNAPVKPASLGPRPTGTSAARPLAAEPLSDRELEVLRLLGTDLSGPEIARQLVVSLNTLHTHTKNIYSKLEVNNRRAAVRRAQELNLL